MIKNGALLATPFLTLTVDSTGERGLLGVAFDPNFATNQFVYVYYTAPGTPTAQPRQPLHRQRRRRRRRQRGRRCSTSTTCRSATNHNGGALHFGPDGKLYIGVGENANGAQRADADQPARARSCASTPTAASRPTTRSSQRPTGNNRAIWALGLRNPFTFAFSPAPAGCSSTTSARTPGRRSTTASPGRTTAGRRPKGRPTTRRFRRRSSPTHDSARHRLRDHRRRFYNPPVAQFPASLHGQLFLRRLLRRLDQDRRSGQPASRSRISRRASARRSDRRSARPAASTI